MSAEKQQQSWNELLKFAERALWFIEPPELPQRIVTTRDYPAPLRPDEEPVSQSSLARDLADQIHTLVKYTPSLGWLERDGGVWKMTKRPANCVELARKWLPSRMPVNGRGHVMTLTSGFVNGVLSFMETDPRILASVDDWDSDAWVLNTPAGPYNLVTGEKITEQVLVMRSTTVAPSNGPTPLWDRVLSDAFPGDTETQRYIEMTLALALVGNQDVHAFWQWSGEGGAGKGTLLGAWMQILGTGKHGYALPIEAKFLTTRRNDNAHPEEIARLLGRRLVVAQETRENVNYDVAIIKGLTGGDTQVGRFMREDTFAFRPTWKLFLAANNRPKYAAEDSGMKRRFREVPFRFKAETDIVGLQTKIVQQEGAAILHKLMCRLREYVTEGLDTPKTVQEATENNRDEQDLVARYFAENVHHEDSRCTPSRTLFEDYIRWCRDNKYYTETSATFYRRVPEDYPAGKSRLHGAVTGVREGAVINGQLGELMSN